MQQYHLFLVIVDEIKPRLTSRIVIAKSSQSRSTLAKNVGKPQSRVVNREGKLTSRLESENVTGRVFWVVFPVPKLLSVSPKETKVVFMTAFGGYAMVNGSPQADST
jgi:hypothetical protein